MESSCGNDFFDAGIRIRDILLRSTDEKISEGTLQALIRDFLPQQEEIMEALINIASKTEFSELIKTKDKQVADRQATIFTTSLSKVYSGETVIAAENLIRGLLALEYQNATNSTKESCPNPDTSMLVAQTKVFQDKISADIRKCEIDTNPKGISATSISKHKSRTVAIVCLTGTFIWLGVLTTYLGLWSNITTQTQSSSTDSSKKCTASLQAEADALAKELASKIDLVDEYRMTGGTWQSILTTYNQNRYMLPQSPLVEDYVAKAMRAKELDAAGCFFDIYHN